MSPEEVVRLAGERGFRAVSLTDHDCIEGIEEAREAGEKHGVEVIPGVELSVEYDGVKDIHMLGYFFDYKDVTLNERLKEFRRVRRERGRKIVDKINAVLAREGRKPLDFDRIAVDVRSALGRPHIARRLVEMGHAADMREAFDRFLNPYNAPKAFFTPAQAIEMLHSAGGVAVLAHPGYTYGDMGRLEKVVSYFSSLGMDGVEVFYGDIRPNNEDFLKYLCYRYRLVVTGGSDFHGDRVGFDAREGGLDINVPYSTVEDLKRFVMR
jgi:hypothetical protein